ncbi:hypothetical protein BH09PSE1_BH09PSE1_25080 [soil metagenome]
MTPDTTEVGRPLRRRRNRPAETQLRQPDGFSPPPRHVLAARIEHAACEALRGRGVDPDTSRLSMVPGWTPERIVIVILEAAGGYVVSLDAGGPGFWRLDHECDTRGRPNRLLISDVWTTGVRAIGWRERHVSIDNQAIAFASPNAPRRFARVLGQIMAGSLVPATPGGRHVH